jgi:hypothetical protein
MMNYYVYLALARGWAPAKSRFVLVCTSSSVGLGLR